METNKRKKNTTVNPLQTENLASKDETNQTHNFQIPINLNTKVHQSPEQFI